MFVYLNYKYMKMPRNAGKQTCTWDIVWGFRERPGKLGNLTAW